MTPAIKHQIKVALKDHRLTVAEARSLKSQARTPEDRKALQQAVDHWGDLFDTGASRALAGVAPSNGADAIRADFKAAAGKGLLHQAEAKAIIGRVMAGGVSNAERRELLRDANLTHALTAQARATFEAFRTEPHGSSALNLFNQRLPSRPGDAGNRLRNDATGTQLFPVKPGATMFDGQGNARGTVTRDGVKINFGQRKTLNGVSCVYAFSTLIRGADGKKHGASGWIAESSLKDGPLKQMPTVNAPRAAADLPGSYRLVGAPAADWGDLKVNPNIPRTARQAAGDYTSRPGGVVNLLFNLPGRGGVATDTLATGNTPFVRAAGVPAVKQPLFLPQNPTAADRAMFARHHGQMEFVYGRVGDRYGWVASANLQPAS